MVKKEHQRPEQYGQAPVIRDEGEALKNPGSGRIPNTDLNPKERRWVVLGALSGALLIGLVFLAGLLLVIALMLILW